MDVIRARIDPSVRLRGVRWRWLTRPSWSPFWSTATALVPFRIIMTTETMRHNLGIAPRIWDFE